MTDSTSLFHLFETVHVFSNSTFISQISINPNRTKTNHHGLTIYKYSTHTKLHHLAVRLRESSHTLKLSNKRKSWTFPLFLDQHQNHKSGRARCSPSLWDFSQINKQKIRFQLDLNKNLCLASPLLSHQQLKHLHKTINRIMLSASL